MSIKRRDLSRRDVVRGGLAATAFGLAHAACDKSRKAAPGPTPGPGSEAKPDQPAVSAKKKILILGGTGFIGPKTIDAAIARGHEVTIFNRGKREKFLPLEHEVEHLYGNRDPDKPADDELGPDGKLLRPDGSPKGLEQLVGRKWDVVIDNSGFVPRIVTASAKLLAPNVGQYIYISSISAYDEASTPATGGDETTKLATLEDPKTEEMGKEFQNYGGLKVLCEQAAEAELPGRTTVVRPGYIVGPGDPTDRFTYWPVRVSEGGDILAPGTPDDPLQWIDVRDLAEWLVHLAEQGTPGAFNAVNPPSPAKWGDVLGACVAASGGKAKLEWVSAEWLEKNATTPEDGFPIWIPPTGKYAGFHRWSNDRAEAAGLKSRSIDDTVKAILAWYPKEIERRVKVTKELVDAAKAAGKPPPPQAAADPKALRAGPPRKRELELIAAWRKSGGAKPK